MFRLQKVKAQGLLNFDRNHLKLFGIDEKLPKDSGKIFVLKICQKCSTSGQKTWRGWLWKLKICTEANQTLLFKRLKNNFFTVAPFRVQISPKYFHLLEPRNNQLVLNIWNTSFLQPVKISIDSLAAVASFQLAPKYMLISESNFQIFHSETIVSLENGGDRANFSIAVI